jgi:acetyltransferase
MSEHYLSRLFTPASVAVVGATERAGALGRFVFQNMSNAGFKGPVYAVNPKHNNVFNSKCYGTIDALPKAPDLIVVTTPAETVAQILTNAGERGVFHAIVLSAGFSETGEAGRARALAVGVVLKRYGIRLLGPNCIGVMRPSVGFNATFSNTQGRAGSIALVSQSGAVCTAILDWAATTEIGFSSVVSLGSALDLDFGEILDFLVYDTETKSILLYVEGIRDARSFISALRAAARVKPVIVMKAGRDAAGTKAVASHTGALTGDDAVFDAALTRSGAIRVRTSAQLFAAARLLADEEISRTLRGERLAIITNGGGPGVVAADCAADNDIKLAKLSPMTIAVLDKALPAHWSHGNPIDLIGDATSDRFSSAIASVAADVNVDAVLVLFCPQATTTAEVAAVATIDAADSAKSGHSKPTFTAWLGGASVQVARALFDSAHIPNFLTPENAVEAFSYLAKFRRHQKLLLEAVPASQAMSLAESLEAVKKAEIVRAEAILDGRTLLYEDEAKRILAAFGLPVFLGTLATTREAAQVAAKALGYPVVMKIQSPDITHKSDVGGVRLNLMNSRQVGNAFDDMIEHISNVRPSAVLDGVNIQPMLKFADAREVLVGLSRDAIFGPVIAFGTGGMAVEAIRDTAVALPPLNDQIATNLIHATRVSRILDAYRSVPAVDEKALVDVLMRVSALACLLPWIREMDLNPVLAHPLGAAVVDARIVIDPNITHTQKTNRYEHMAIHPYPVELERSLKLKDGATLLMRAIRPDDAERERIFMASLSQETRYYRFLHPIAELSADMIARFTQLDYAREMALIALDTGQPADHKIAGVARYHPNPDRVSAEFAVTIGDEWQARGLGGQLMRALIECARAAGYLHIQGTIHPMNVGMLHLATSLGFTIESTIPALAGNLDTVKVTLKLAESLH